MKKSGIVFITRKLICILSIAVTAVVLNLTSCTNHQRASPSIIAAPQPENKPQVIAKDNPGYSDEGLNRNENHLILTKHARCRMECRHITEAEIRDILHDGTINFKKSELHAERGPKYAVEGYLHDRQHLRVIFAPEPHSMVVVTCIDLDTEWQCPSCN